MRVALLTVGDELLAGDTVDGNAAWLAERITERGGEVRRILTLPDERALIAETVADWRGAFDAVVVTGGLGGTPDDVTVEAVADAVDRELVVFPDQRERLERRREAFVEEHPEYAESYEFDWDLDAAASLPAGSRPLATDQGWAPGCVVGNVYVFPGFPDEMRAMFALVAGEFGGDRVVETLHTPAPEGSLGGALTGVHERFDVAVGSYPAKGDAAGRLRLTGEDAAEVAAAADWLRERVETVDPPEE